MSKKQRNAQQILLALHDSLVQGAAIWQIKQYNLRASGRHLVADSFLRIDPKGWKAKSAWPTADGLPT